ncbi:MAG: adenylosuccinate synthase [Candidatus Thermoplasmatota archaeon]|nr:adenylosuccinate synthase [Candidatus Thermoplasmatota archaeon]
MTVTLVVGTQWGDEGKGKVVDYYSKQADYVVRFQGGSVIGDTPIFIKKGKQSGIIAIKNFIDPFYKENEEGVKEIRNTSTIGVKISKNPGITDFTFANVSGVYRHQTDHIYNVKYNGGTVSLTADHSIFVYTKHDGKLSVKKTSDLKKGDILISFPHKNMLKSHNRGDVFFPDVSNPQTTILQYKKDSVISSLPLSEGLLKLFGYYLAEGNASIRTRKRKEKYRKSPSIDYDITFSFNTKEKHHIKTVKKLMSSLFNEQNPHVFSPPNESSETCVRYSKKYLAEFFKELFGSNAKTKRLPDFIYTLPKNQFLIFFEYYLAGDGYFHKSGKIEVGTVSKNLAVQLNWLLNIHNIKSTLLEKTTKERNAPQGHLLRRTKVYTIKIGASCNPFLIKGRKRINNYYLRRVIKISKQPYSGYVYDLCGCDNEAFFGGNSPILLHNSNAGHTIKVGDEVYKLHLTPSGVIQGKTGIIANGVVVDPEILFQEIDELTKRGIKPRLLISDRANIIMPYHKILDGAEEAYLGDKKIGTTKRGIGPCYSDKVARNGIRAIDLTNKASLQKLLARILPIKQKLIDIYGIKTSLNEKEILETYSAYGKRLQPYITSTHLELNKAIMKEKRVLLEGAQGTMLDVEFGTYPYTTSSHVIAGGSAIGAGIGPRHIDEIIGIVKAYTTRVGEGPMPTELLDKTGQHLQQVGHEFGTTTSRPRRCGWLDLVVVRHSCIISGITKLAITKLDVLNGLSEIEVCTHYMLHGKKIQYFPANIDDVAACKPEYTTFKGWGAFDSSAKKLSQLPKEAQAYLRFIEKETGVPISLVSIGPGRDETIEC